MANTAVMYAHLLEATAFAVNILAAGQDDLANHFAGRPVPGLDVVFSELGGVSTLAHASAWITADTTDRHACGDHTIVVGRIRQLMADDRAPLVFHAGRFGTMLTGVPSVPTPEFW